MRSIWSCVVGTLLTTSVCIGAQAQSTQTESAAAVQTQPAPWRARFGAANSSTSQAQPNPPGFARQQTPPSSPPPTRIDPGSITPANQPDSNNTQDKSLATDSNSSITRVTRTFSQLPRDAGQVWREYDISPYTSQIKSNEKPQQAVLDWILRETGTEMWFNAPMGILNADRNHIYVYHTPEIHTVIKNIIDRFVNTRGQVQVLDLNLVTVENPNWRALSYWMLQPIEVQSPGAEAWMISKENAALLMGQISRRADFKRHSGGRISAHDGQEVVLEKKTPRQFVQNLRWLPGQIPNFQPQMTTIKEGYRLSISSLSSLNTKTIEATIKCDVDQIERLNTVRVDVPAAGGNGPTQMNLQVPQVVNWRLQERFRWPNDQVLLLSCGVVASPEAGSTGPINLPRIFSQRRRADALLFIEYRGPANGSQRPAVTANQTNLVPVRRN